MNKKGFTLIELMVVIVIMSIAGTTSVIIFDRIDGDTSIVDRENMYKNIQKSAMVYMDINDNKLQEFIKSSDNEDGLNLYVKVGTLMSENYINENLTDPVTKNSIPSNYLVKIYVSVDSLNNKYLDSCIIDSTKLNSTSGSACIADNDGKSNKYCCANKPIPTPLPSNVDAEGMF